MYNKLAIISIYIYTYMYIYIHPRDVFVLWQGFQQVLCGFAIMDNYTFLFLFCFSGNVIRCANFNFHIQNLDTFHCIYVPGAVLRIIFPFPLTGRIWDYNSWCCAPKLQVILICHRLRLFYMTSFPHAMVIYWAWFTISALSPAMIWRTLPMIIHWQLIYRRLL